MTEEDIVQVSELPTNGTRWFSRKHLILNAQQDFLLPGKHVETKGRGVALQSLPLPWLKFVEFVKQYFTCEGRYQVIYQHDFVLLNHLRHGHLINMPYYLLGCLKNMSRYTVNAKHQLLSLKHHRLVQLLINRGFALNHPPLLINPPQGIEENPQQDEEIPQQAEEIPQQAEEIPQQTEEILQQIEENPQQGEENSQQLEHSPQKVAENQQSAAETPQVSTENLQRTPSPSEAEPSTPIVHISTDDSDDNTPIIFRKRKKQQQTVTPPKRRRTRASVKEAAIPDSSPILTKSGSKRKITDFPASLPRRRKGSSATIEPIISIIPSSPPIMLRSRIPTSSEHSPSSPSGAEMQSVDNFVTLFSLKEVAVTQEPAAETSRVDTQDDIGQVAVTQEPATDPTGATQEPPVGKQKDNDLHVAVAQEPATDPTGDTQEPLVADANDQTDAEQRSLPPLEPAITQAPTTLASL